MSRHTLSTARSQRGLSLIGTIIVGGLLAFVLFIALRSVPVFNEYLAIKRVVGRLSADMVGGSTAADARRAFDRFAYTDDIVSITGADLRIAGSGPNAVIETAYERKVPIAGNVSLLFEFYVTSGR